MHTINTENHGFASCKVVSPWKLVCVSSRTCNSAGCVGVCVLSRQVDSSTIQDGGQDRANSF